MENPGDRIIVSLNMRDLSFTKTLLRQLRPHVKFFMIGPQIFSLVGPKAFHLIGEEGGRVFYHSNLCDTPEITEEAARHIAEQGVEMFSVNATMGVAGMKAAKNGNERGFNPDKVTPQRSNPEKSKIIAFTVPTWLNNEQCQDIFGNDCKSTVQRFVSLVEEAEIDGIICSPWELWSIRQSSLIKVVPGIRPASYENGGDQTRVMTPGEAIMLGADLLIIGRPITMPTSGTSLDATLRIIEEIAEALDAK